MNSSVHKIVTLDWIVIATYGAGMLLVGWYFIRKTKTHEQYMLGGRTMKPWAVGMSLFATLLSTISYLAYPGELIKYGPIAFFMLVSYPFIYLVVGWILIPAIMKQQVSSAYELLDVKLGTSVRLLASIIFLLMRWIWMALIIYTVADRIVIPIMGWPKDAALYTSIAAGIFTVIFTSMGGLQGVVWTDVIQTFILFTAALAAVGLININLGSIIAWIPEKTPESWLTWKLFDPNTRISAIPVCLLVFGWYVCTCGSDQMAIQRYLSTRNAKEARKSMLINLITDSFVMSMLCLLGLSLLAYFQSNHNLLPEGETISSYADKLYLHYIMISLPAGVKGLVVAGLLAAAMSSLSSGINSSCLVIREDFIALFRRTNLSEAKEVRLDRVFSLGIGIIIVLLSLVIGKVKGDLLEITSKTVNLPVAPLFVPFFMAFFVPKATQLGTIVGTLASIIAGTMISFSDEFFGKPISFTLILPVAFMVGVSVSIFLSLIWPNKKPDLTKQAN